MKKKNSYSFASHFDDQKFSARKNIKRKRIKLNKHLKKKIFKHRLQKYMYQFCELEEKKRSDRAEARERLNEKEIKRREKKTIKTLF